MKVKSLLTFANAKTSKGEDLGYLTGILYLAPEQIVNGVNLCPFASKGCKQACLFTSGRGVFSNVKQARINKTILYRDNLNLFMSMLVKDIKKAIKKADKLNLTPVIRLNGTSDIDWENIRYKTGKNIFEIFPNIQFYDYTKNFKRFDKKLPTNYHLTFSLSESNKRHALKLADNGVNVAAVFGGKSLPTMWNSKKVINGDNHDLRFLDEKNTIVGLIAKGQARKDNSGFVQKVM